MTAPEKAPDIASLISKFDKVLALLNGENGATLAEITRLTCWLPHTARAALTGLRKKGHAITRGKRGEVTVYRIAGQA